MSFNNRNNLPNPSAPWGREVEQRIEGAERNISQTSLESSNGLSSTSNTLSALQATIQSLQAQQSTLVQQQARIAEASSLIPRSVNFVKVGGTSTGRTLEFSDVLTKPAWASFAVVGFITTSVVGTLDPDSGAEDPFISGVAYASGSPIPNEIDILAGEEVWYVGPLDSYSTYKNFAVPVTDVLYLKQFVFYNEVINCTLTASQAITVQWI